MPRVWHIQSKLLYIKHMSHSYIPCESASRHTSTEASAAAYMVWAQCVAWVYDWRSYVSTGELHGQMWFRFHHQSYFGVCNMKAVPVKHFSTLCSVCSSFFCSFENKNVSLQWISRFSLHVSTDPCNCNEIAATAEAMLAFSTFMEFEYHMVKDVWPFILCTSKYHKLIERAPRVGCVHAISTNHR